MAQPDWLTPEVLRVGPSELDSMAAAAEIIRCCRDGAMLREIAEGEIVAWQHYPDGEVYDPSTHAQYFYHVHPETERGAREHGHFHVFLRAEGMPAETKPLLLPEMAVADAPTRIPQAAPLKRGGRNEVSHLVAIAVDRQGEPIRLFTTNRWVTGETWYAAEDVIRMLDRFSVERGAPRLLANVWVGAIMRLFRPQIAALLRRRDEVAMACRRRWRTHVFEDPRLEITSSLDVALDAQLAVVDSMRTGVPMARPPLLPRMAEGWGEDGSA